MLEILIALYFFSAGFFFFGFRLIAKELRCSPVDALAVALLWPMFALVDGTIWVGKWVRQCLTRPTP